MIKGQRISVRRNLGRIRSMRAISPGGITRSVQVPKGPRGSVKPKKDGSIGLILSVCIPKMKFYDDEIVLGKNGNRWKLAGNTRARTCTQGSRTKGG